MRSRRNAPIVAGPYIARPRTGNIRCVNARRLAALDMHGAHGSCRRRRLVNAEFIAAAFVGVALGVWVIGAASHWPTLLFGVYLLGIGVNYCVLAHHARRLLRQGALERELADCDPMVEMGALRRSLGLLLVPFGILLSDLWHTAAG